MRCSAQEVNAQQAGHVIIALLLVAAVQEYFQSYAHWGLGVIGVAV
jgi:hypothetical protein